MGRSAEGAAVDAARAVAACSSSSEIAGANWLNSSSISSFIIHFVRTFNSRQFHVFQPSWDAIATMIVSIHHRNSIDEKKIRILHRWQKNHTIEEKNLWMRKSIDEKTSRRDCSSFINARRQCPVMGNATVCPIQADTNGGQWEVDTRDGQLSAIARTRWPWTQWPDWRQ